MRASAYECVHAHTVLRKRPDAGLGGRAGGDDVVDEHDTPRASRAHGEGASDIVPALDAAERRLVSGIARASQHLRGERSVRRPRELTREQRRLVEAAFDQSSEV